MAVPLQRGCPLLATVLAPVCHGDVLANARQTIADVEIFHVHAGIVGLHLSRGVFVSVERQPIVLARVAALAVLRQLDAHGKQLVLLVGHVPVAHLPLRGESVLLRLHEDVARLLIDGNRKALLLLQARAIAIQCLLQRGRRFVEFRVLVALGVGGIRPTPSVHSASMIANDSFFIMSNDYK